MAIGCPLVIVITHGIGQIQVFLCSVHYGIQERNLATELKELSL